MIELLLYILIGIGVYMDGRDNGYKWWESLWVAVVWPVPLGYKLPELFEKE